MAKAWFALACIALLIGSLAGTAWAFYATHMSYANGKEIFGGIAGFTICAAIGGGIAFGFACAFANA